MKEIIELIKSNKPGVTDQEIDFILWERTSYPFGTEDYIKKEVLNLLKINV